MSSALSNSELCELYQRYAHLLVRRCRLRLGDAALADDALQDLFYKLMRHGGAIRAVDSQLAWLYRAADRCCYDIARRQQRQRQVAQPPSEDVPAVGAADRSGVLEELFARLNPDERHVATLLFDDGMTQTEASKQLGRSRQSINRQARAIRELAQKLLQEVRGAGVG